MKQILNIFFTVLILSGCVHQNAENQSIAPFVDALPSFKEEKNVTNKCETKRLKMELNFAKTMRGKLVSDDTVRIKDVNCANNTFITEAEILLTNEEKFMLMNNQKNAIDGLKHDYETVYCTGVKFKPYRENEISLRYIFHLQGENKPFADFTLSPSKCKK